MKTIDTPELAAFLNRDTNKLATLVIVRDTVDPDGLLGDAVHAFAGNRHPTLPPPLLTVR